LKLQDYSITYRIKKDTLKLSIIMFALLTGFMLYKSIKGLFLNFLLDYSMQRKPDIKLARKLRDWEPDIKLEEDLRKNIDYFKDIL